MVSSVVSVDVSEAAASLSVVGICLERIQREASLLTGGHTEGGIVEVYTNVGLCRRDPSLSARQDVDPAASCFQGPSSSPLLVPSETHRQAMEITGGAAISRFAR